MTMDREWEKFRRGPFGTGSDAVRVTLNNRGMIYLNAKAYQILGRPQAVAIYYNREADAIALEPAHARIAENFPVMKRQNGYSVHASTFCRHFRIRVPATQRFVRPDLTNEGQLILSLRDTANVGGRQTQKPDTGRK